jgi:predicted dehydrogenase
MSAAAAEAATAAARLGFLGVGWIGKHRMEAILRSGRGRAVALADPSEESLRAALEAAPGAAAVESLEALLRAPVDGVVIATPSALHAGQSILALEAGKAVFCQKPLGRSAAEVRAVVDAARRADRLLGVDLSYRFVQGMPRLRELVASGALGHVFAADLVFHNAYGPDKPWFYDARLSGGGCLVDLGIHLVDLLLWLLPGAHVTGARGRLLAGGQPVRRREAVEDYAAVHLEVEAATGPCAAGLCCSWRLHAGRDAVIEVALHGTRAGAALRNVDGSFHDFTLDLFRGTAREPLSAPPDDWGGRAAVDWAARLSGGARFDPEVERLVAVAEALDRIYDP